MRYAVGILSLKKFVMSDMSIGSWVGEAGFFALHCFGLSVGRVAMQMCLTV